MTPARGAGEGTRRGRVRSEEERRRGRRPRGRYGQRVKMVEPLKSDSRVAEELLDDEARMQSGGREGSLRREAGRAVCSGTRRVQRYTVRGETAGEGGGGGKDAS